MPAQRLTDIRLTKPLPVKRITPNPIMDSYTVATLPDKFFLTKNSYGWGACDITYLDPENPNNRIKALSLPGSVQLEELQGEERAELYSKFEAFKETYFSFFLKGLYKEVGSDPEIFVEDEKGEVIPAFKFLGSKANPNIGPGFYENYPIYWDGFAAEFCTRNDPCLAWQCDSVFYGLKRLLKLARQYNPKAKLSSKTLITIPDEVLAAAPEEYVQFGCMPSFNAYGLKGNIEPGGRAIPYRSTGGHIHFGFGEQPEEKVTKIVKALDAILAVACVSLFGPLDHPTRRRYYGLPGEYRLPKHGLEYRTLSNAWMFHPLIMNIVFDLARQVTNLANNDMAQDWKASEDEVLETVFTCNQDKARDILTRNKPLLTNLCAASYEDNQQKGQVVSDIFMKGMSEVLQTPTDIANNWCLDGHWVTHCDGQGKNVRTSYEALGKGLKV